MPILEPPEEGQGNTSPVPALPPRGISVEPESTDLDPSQEAQQDESHSNEKFEDSSGDHEKLPEESKKDESEDANIPADDLNKLESLSDKLETDQTVDDEADPRDTSIDSSPEPEDYKDAQESVSKESIPEAEGSDATLNVHNIVLCYLGFSFTFSWLLLTFCFLLEPNSLLLPLV